MSNVSQVSSLLCPRLHASEDKGRWKKKEKRKYCELQITTAYFEVLSLKKNQHQVEL